MNYNYLRYFSVLAQMEHYTLAAEQLGISQPSLSSAIRNLEKELGGVQLFEKVGRNIRLTEEGRYYQKKVDEALDQLNAAAQTIMAGKDNAPVVIRLGFVSGSMTPRIAQEIAEYTRQNRRVRFQMVESSCQEIINMVRQDRLDMGVVDVQDADRSLYFRRLCQRELYAAMPLSHPLADSDAIDYQAIAQDPQITFNHDMSHSFEQWAEGMQQAKYTVCTVNTTQAAMALVAAGMGVTLVTEEYAKPQRNVICVPLQDRKQTLYLCSVRDRWIDPIIWRFGQQLTQCLREQ
ncbi:MAG: LysR family transcriptional regulator [Oscillospiraceae bacterium]|nr:LysR family transcriptional regulator [Oscillospiraceae bacterium]